VLTLALDTTTRGGSAALIDGTTMRSVVPGDPARTHGERLPGELEQALTEGQQSLAAVELLAVAHGPGAFTGIRIGLACMQGLSLTLGRPVVGVSALEALAFPHGRTGGHEVIGACMDAGRGEVFLQWFRRDPSRVWGLMPASAPAVGTAEALLADADTALTAGGLLCGDGALKVASLLGAAWVVAGDSAPLAPAVAALAQMAWAGEPDATRWTPDALEPLYVRRPDVEVTREARQQG
jgi:tRNA threonylcarbamoyladenosine biosynthesis protein TsaB